MTTLLTEYKFRPPTREFDGNTENFRGRYKGALEVVGLSRDIQGAWVCECLCGNYCFRKAKALKNPDNLNDSCKACKGE